MTEMENITLTKDETLVLFNDLIGVNIVILFIKHYVPFWI